jgi:glucokinase
MMYILGFDIGGTKCAAVCAVWDGKRVEIVKKGVIPTDTGVPAEVMLERLCALADTLLEKTPDAVGISCGGPLDAERGLILSPPNLPGWDRVEIVKIIEEHYRVKTRLMNDANASAVAEWRFGAGRGCRNVVFMTFGTGLGAGLILDGRLYEGTSGNAGEVGHVRLAEDGPVGFGKKGSFEGFCSGGGIARLARQMAEEAIEKGERPLYYTEGELDTRAVADAARLGDRTALEVFRVSGERLGLGLAMIVDVLNPEVIVIGSVFARCHDLLWEAAERVLMREAIDSSVSAVRVVPAELGESIGDLAAVAAAIV